MREIKFRAWDKLNNEMLKSPLDSYYAIGRFFGFIPETSILMQYTGLHDKNGREIYEGDVVMAREQNNISKKKHKQEVIYYYGCFMLAMLPKKIRLRNISAPFIENDIEIIGNVHENKELLNG